MERKLAGILGKEEGTLVVKASDRDVILEEISAYAARYERSDKVIFNELKVLRNNVRDVFNKGLDPGHEIMDQLFFLEASTRSVLEKMSHNYTRIVTPEDFKKIANIMSDHLAEKVPILKDFTKFFGRLAEEFLKHAKPRNSAVDWKAAAKVAVLGDAQKGYTIPKQIGRLLGIKDGTVLSEATLKRFSFWKPGGTLAEFLYGAQYPLNRSPKLNMLDFKLKQINKKFTITLSKADKLPKSWTNIPWVNFDGKVIEQGFTQAFEEKLAYKDKDGNWINNIVQIRQKTEASWWDQIVNKSGSINDIADAQKARTAYAVNGNHSNDAVIVKRFHLWGKKNNVATSTIHDAFFTNITQMLPARKALRGIYADTLKRNVVEEVLKEMKKRGLPEEVYRKYLEEAIMTGLIPVAGKSNIGGKVLKASDILTIEDILEDVVEEFDDDRYWYGVG